MNLFVSDKTTQSNFLVDNKNDACHAGRLPKIPCCNNRGQDVQHVRVVRVDFRVKALPKAVGAPQHDKGALLHSPRNAKQQVKFLLLIPANKGRKVHHVAVLEVIGH